MACSKICKIVTVVLRYLLGLMCLIFGANKFFHFMDMPPLPEAAQNLMMALGEAGYFMPILGAIFLVVGLALVLGRYVPLALVILFPVAINTLLFHAALDPAGIGAAAVLTGLNVILMWKHKSDYAGLLKPKCCHSGACK